MGLFLVFVVKFKMGNEKAHADKKLLNLLNFFMRYARQMAINATTQKFNTNSILQNHCILLSTTFRKITNAII
jgi:hypothetical protein